MTVAGVPHLIFLAKYDIRFGQEVLYNYGDTSKNSLEAFPWLGKGKVERVPEPEELLPENKKLEVSKESKETDEKQEGVEDKVEEPVELPEENWVADALKVIKGGSKEELQSIIEVGTQRLKNIVTH